MEGIERALRRYEDRERVVHAAFPHFDPQLPRALSPEEPHSRPARHPLGQLADSCLRRGRGRLGRHDTQDRAAPGTAASPTAGEKAREIGTRRADTGSSCLAATPVQRPIAEEVLSALGDSRITSLSRAALQRPGVGSHS